MGSDEYGLPVAAEVFLDGIMPQVYVLHSPSSRLLRS
jgi:hypothetical protein